MARPTTPEISKIRAWIDNSNFYEDIFLEEDAIKKVSDAVDRSDLLSDLQDKLDYYIQESYDEGQNDYEIEDKDSVPELMQEEIGCNFVVEQFKDCQTVQDFQNLYSELYSRSLNFMR